MKLEKTKKRPIGWVFTSPDVPAELIGYKARHRLHAELKANAHGYIVYPDGDVRPAAYPPERTVP